MGDLRGLGGLGEGFIFRLVIFFKGCFLGGRFVFLFSFLLLGCFLLIFGVCCCFRVLIFLFELFSHFISCVFILLSRELFLFFVFLNFIWIFRFPFLVFLLFSFFFAI